MASRSVRRLSSHVRVAVRNNSPAFCGLTHAGQFLRTTPVDQIQMRKFSTPGKIEPDVDAIAYGFMASQALFTALELNLFDSLDQPRTVEELQKSTGITAPRLQTLLTALTSVNLLWNQNGVYSLPKNVAQTMVTTSKYYYGDYLKLQIGRQFYVQMGHLPQVMSTGAGPDYAEWFADGETADTYTKAQHNGSLATAFALMKRVDLSSSKKVLDVGGGSGAFQVGMCIKFPECQSYVLELPNVAVTGEKIVADGHPEVKDRIKFIKGSALDAWPADTPKTAWNVQPEHPSPNVNAHGCCVNHWYRVPVTLCPKAPDHIKAPDGDFGNKPSGGRFATPFRNLDSPEEADARIEKQSQQRFICTCGCGCKPGSGCLASRFEDTPSRLYERMRK